MPRGVVLIRLGLVCAAMAIAGCAPYFATEDAPSGQVASGDEISNPDQWPFGAQERPWHWGEPVPTSIALLKRIANETFALPPDWKPHLENFSRMANVEKLTTVNSLVNRIPYRPESRDKWRHPEVFMREGGDCDCNAVAKYALLRYLGVPADDIRITLVQGETHRSFHMVIIVRMGRGIFDTFVLDNADHRVRTARYSGHIRPFLSVNETGAWLHQEMAPKSINKFLNPLIAEP